MKMATNDLQLFDFNSHNIRVMEIDGQPWFIAVDVATVLGYREPRLAIRTHCKGGAKRTVLTKGGRQSATIIPERDVYRLIMRSKLPSAEAFEEWVVGTVLPAIRKDGGYVRGEENVETEEDIMEMSLRTMDMLRKKLDEKTQKLDDGDQPQRYLACDTHAGGGRRRQRNFTSVVDRTSS